MHKQTHIQRYGDNVLSYCTKNRKQGTPLMTYAPALQISLIRNDNLTSSYKL